MKKLLAILLSLSLSLMLFSCGNEVNEEEIPQDAETYLEGYFNAFVENVTVSEPDNQGNPYIYTFELMQKEPFIISVVGDLGKNVEKGKSYKFEIKPTVIDKEEYPNPEALLDPQVAYPAIYFECANITETEIEDDKYNFLKIRNNSFVKETEEKEKAYLDGYFFASVKKLIPSPNNETYAVLELFQSSPFIVKLPADLAGEVRADERYKFEVEPIYLDRAKFPNLNPLAIPEIAYPALHFKFKSITQPAGSGNPCNFLKINYGDIPEEPEPVINPDVQKVEDDAENPYAKWLNALMEERSINDFDAYRIELQKLYEKLYTSLPETIYGGIEAIYSRFESGTGENMTQDTGYKIFAKDLEEVKPIVEKCRESLNPDVGKIDIEIEECKYSLRELNEIADEIYSQSFSDRKFVEIYIYEGKLIITADDEKELKEFLSDKPYKDAVSKIRVREPLTPLN